MKINKSRIITGSLTLILAMLSITLNVNSKYAEKRNVTAMEFVKLTAEAQSEGSNWCPAAPVYYCALYNGNWLYFDYY